jgi:hypothetical protein
MKYLKIMLVLLSVFTLSFTVENEHKEKTTLIETHATHNHTGNSRIDERLKSVTSQRLTWRCVNCKIKTRSTQEALLRTGCKSRAATRGMHLWRVYPASWDQIIFP